MRTILAAAFLLSSCTRGAPAPPPLPPPAPQAVAPTELPAGDGAALVTSRCTICHTVQLPLLQRLTAAQWKKTVAKMKGWGAPVNDAEAAQVEAYLGQALGPEVPEPELRLVPVPDGGT